MYIFPNDFIFCVTKSILINCYFKMGIVTDIHYLKDEGYNLTQTLSRFFLWMSDSKAETLWRRVEQSCLIHGGGETKQKE